MKVVADGVSAVDVDLVRERGIVKGRRRMKGRGPMGVLRVCAGLDERLNTDDWLHALRCSGREQSSHYTI